MYSLKSFGDMIADRVRMDAYAEALKRTVTPGSVVVDLGAGTGIMSLLACQLGARHVYAVEPSDASQLIQAAARDNGFAGRITVFQARSSAVSLPEPADVMVSDMRGTMPTFHSHLADIADARRRLLKPNGRQIPQRDRLFVAAVSSERAFERDRGIWQSAPFGLDLRSTLQHVAHSWGKHRAAPEDLLSEPVCWAELEYATRTDPHVRGEAVLRALRPGVAHGLLLWFDTVLTEGVGFSNAPGQPEAVYGAALHPLTEPLSLQPGDELRVELRADPVGARYRWSWFTRLHRAADPDRVAQRFRQSDFLSWPLSPSSLRKRADDFAPALSSDGELALHALSRMQDGLTVSAIAAELYARAADRFGSEAEALELVADLSERYSR